MRSITGTILYLDLATNTGWCAGEPGVKVPQFGHHTLPSTGDNIGRFACEYEDWFGWLLDEKQPALVGFEMPILPQKTQLSTVRKLTGLAYDTERQCRRRAIRCVEGRASTVKKFFVGSGKAEKADTMHMCRRYGWRVTTDDEADACAGWAYLISCYAPEHAGMFNMGPLAAGRAA